MLEGGLLVILIDGIFLSPFLDVVRMFLSSVSLLALLALEFSTYRMIFFALSSKWF